MSTQIVMATPEILTRFYGKRPRRTVHAIAALRGEEIVGVAGFYPDQHRQVMFTDMTEAVRQDKRLMIRGYRMLLDLARSRRTDVHAVADPVEGAEKLLEHVGFSKMPGTEVFVWQA